jgi:uncharacterized protein YdhG (YjbR/CyaY superfamily)
MKSSADSVNDYISGTETKWRPVLERLRAACLEQLHGYEEAMAYGMPTYARRGQPEIAFAKQANYLSLYVMKTGVLESHRKELSGLNPGKGCIRYRRPDQIDMSLISVLLAETVESAEKPC